MSLPYHTWYRLVRQRNLMAAEIPASMSTHRAWVAVYPLPDTDTFNIRAFEIDRYILDQGYDIGEADLLNLQMVVAVPEDQLEVQLRAWISDIQQLVVPWQCDFPV